MKSFRIALLLMLILNLNLSAKSFKVNGIVYETWIDNTVRVIGGETSLRKVVIPDSVIYDGVNCKVVEISTGAFMRSKITSVTIPSSVVNVSHTAFQYCDSLTTVVFEDSKDPISLYPPATGYGSFDGCNNLREVYIGRNLQSFYKDKYEPIKLGAYDSIKSITFGNLVDSIPRYLCYDCKTEQKIQIPDSVKYIGERAFDGANIPDTLDLSYVVSVENNAFAGTDIKVVILGNDLEQLENYAFAYCGDIESVYMLKTKAITCDEYLFDQDVYNNATLYVPKGRIQAYSRTTPWNRFYIEELKPFSVTFIIDGNVHEKKYVDYGDEIILPEPPFKEGYTFNGWVNLPPIMPAKDITVTGSFSVNSYNVTFVVDGEVYKTIPVKYDEEIPMPEEPVKEGCTFGGWSEVPATMPAEDIIITGSFYANYYTVTYVVDGEIYATATVGYNSVIPEMEEPIKEGHTFNGWEYIPDVMPAKDITITGSFTVNSYKAIFLVDNTLYTILTVNYGEAIELPEAPQKYGFLFEGWSGLPESMPAEDIVLIAIFTDITGINDVKDEKVRTVYYDLNGRVVENPTKGVYIIDGKKVLIK